MYENRNYKICEKSFHCALRKNETIDRGSRQEKLQNVLNDLLDDIGLYNIEDIGLYNIRVLETTCWYR